MLQYTKIPSDAEDIVQSAFLKLWEKRESLGSVSKPDSWLFIVARNDFLNRFDKLSSEANYRSYVKEIFEEEWGSPEELLITRQSRKIIQQALDNLSQKQKEAFSLSRIDGLSYAEIAEVMGVGRATVKEHIVRATRAVVSFLKRHKDSLIGVVAVSMISY
jgi:RNA polymerase sigma-70 factor (ECF subfamily)